MSNNNKYKLEIEKRITTLEANYKELHNEILEIKDNHLQAIQKKVDRIQWLLVTTLIAIIINFLRIYVK